jgi:hypothetical protein
MKTLDTAVDAVLQISRTGKRFRSSRLRMHVNNLSFDPAHPWFEVPGVPGAEWALELFTTENVYGLDPSRTEFDGRSLGAAGLQRLGGQHKAAGTATVECRLGDDGVTTWVVVARIEETVKGVKLLLRNLPEALLEQGWWTPTTLAGSSLKASGTAPLLLVYPWAGSGGGSWQTPWISAGEGPALVVSVRDDVVRGIRFYSYRPHWSESDIVEVICTPSAAARGNAFETPEIRLSLCADDVEIKRDFDDHLAWIEDTYQLSRWEERRDVPPWADQLDLVVTLHGQHWTGFVFNTFEQMAAILQSICDEVPGERVLAYLPGWEGRYYWQYPTYRPGDELGGEEGFAWLVERARSLGVHLMPMFGANGANVHRYPDWEQAAFRSPSNRYAELVNRPDWDNDRAGEDEQVFLNPGEAGFQKHLADQVSSIVERYGVEGIFLDTSACWFDDPRYDVYRGYRELVGEIRRRHPDLLVCGEGWYDALLAVFPMNQTWIDMADAPRFDDLPMRYSRVLGHLKDGAPGAGSTGVHEDGTSPLAVPLRRGGFVPALPVVHDTFTTHRAEALAFCRSVVKEPL